MLSCLAPANLPTTAEAVSPKLAERATLALQRFTVPPRSRHRTSTAGTPGKDHVRHYQSLALTAIVMAANGGARTDDSLRLQAAIARDGSGPNSEDVEVVANGEPAAINAAHFTHQVVFVR